MLALTDSELCLQVTRNKAFLRDVQAAFREQLPLFTATGGESQAPGEEASKAEAVGSLPSASQPLKERSPCVAMLHGIPKAGSHPLTQRETLPEPYITCCQLSETHRNRPVFFKLADIRTWRNVGGNLKMNSKVSWSPSQPDDVSELFQKKHRWLAEDC